MNPYSPPYSLPVVTPGDGFLQEGEELSSLPLPHQEGPHLLPLRAAALHMEVLHKRNSLSRWFSFAKNDQKSFSAFYLFLQISPVED
jgi:hypothetical protein